MNTSYRTRAFYALHALALAAGIAEDEERWAIEAEQVEREPAPWLRELALRRAAVKANVDRSLVAQHSVWAAEIPKAWERFAAA